MKPNQEFSFLYGLTLLDAEEMRTLLFDILSYDTNGKIENAIEFVYDSKTSITNKILEKLREQDATPF